MNKILGLFLALAVLGSVNLTSMAVASPDDDEIAAASTPATITFYSRKGYVYYTAR